MDRYKVKRKTKQMDEIVSVHKKFLLMKQEYLKKMDSRYPTRRYKVRKGTLKPRKMDVIFNREMYRLHCEGKEVSLYGTKFVSKKMEEIRTAVMVEAYKKWRDNAKGS